jgi:hypothetical protein
VARRRFNINGNGNAITGAADDGNKQQMVTRDLAE